MISPNLTGGIFRDSYKKSGVSHRGEVISLWTSQPFRGTLNNHPMGDMASFDSHVQWFNYSHIIIVMQYAFDLSVGYMSIILYLDVAGIHVWQSTRILSPLPMMERSKPPAEMCHTSERPECISNVPCRNCCNITSIWYLSWMKEIPDI